MPVKEKNEVVDYSEVLNDYFKRHPIEIRAIPDYLLQNIEVGCSNFEVLSVDEYSEYLDQEINFWIQNDPNKQFDVFSNTRNLNDAIKKLERAKSLATNPNHYDIAYSELRDSISSINGKCLCSKTTVAEFLITECIDKNKFYVEGIKAGLSASRQNQAPLSIDGMTGFYTALNFLDSLDNGKRFCQIEFEKLNKNVELVNKNYTILNEKYFQSHQRYEQVMGELKLSAEKQIDDVNKTTIEYFKERDKRCEEFEHAYFEKLRLAAPADYWEQMERDYKKKAQFWVIMSVLVAVFTILGLVLVLSQLPNLFTKDSHWLDIFKNSAIFTIALSICVYILRLFVKLATSSFHLSRDAKERNKLSYFYLALIEQGAVSDKERAIILSALFSRADTGLLKGDSSPSMPSTMNEIVTGLTK